MTASARSKGFGPGLLLGTAGVMLVALFLTLPVPPFADGGMLNGMSHGSTAQRTSNVAYKPAPADNSTSVVGVPAHDVVPDGSRDTQVIRSQSVRALGEVWFYDSFESGSVYTYWDVLDTFTWGASTFANFTGDYSAWCLGSSSFGDYPNNYVARMVRGPYNLSSSSGQTVVNAMVWLESELNYDYAGVFVSTDGYNYYGTEWSGMPLYWESKTLNLSNVYLLGNVSRASRLWVMLKFRSDGSNSVGDGVFFDDVTLKDLGTPQPMLPDLVSSSVIGPSSANSGSAISISDTVLNQGVAAASGFSTSYYLSSDTNITGSDTYLGNRYISSLSAGGTNSATSSFTLPPGVVGTYYYIGAIADSGGSVAESNEGNNARVGNTILVSAPPRTTSVVLTSGSASALRYGSVFLVSGALMDANGGLAGQQVILQSATGGAPFQDTGLATTTGPAGVFSFAVRPTARCQYVVRFTGLPGTYTGSISGTSVYATPQVSLGTPVAPTRMSPSKSYSVYGSLTPRHTAGTKPVRIYRYKKVGGRWVSYGYVSAYVSSYGSHSRYRASLRLASKGNWCLRAYAPADSGHAATWSAGYDYVSVK